MNQIGSEVLFEKRTLVVDQIQTEVIMIHVIVNQLGMLVEMNQIKENQIVGSIL